MLIMANANFSSLVIKINGIEGFSSALIRGYANNLPLHAISVHYTIILVQLSLFTHSGVFGLCVAL